MRLPACTPPDSAWRVHDDPPARGWYIASIQRSPSLFRWWNGVYWSSCVGAHRPPEYAALYATTARCGTLPIYWLPQEWISRLYPEARL